MYSGTGAGGAADGDNYGSPERDAAAAAARKKKKGRKKKTRIEVQRSVDMDEQEGDDGGSHSDARDFFEE